MSNARNLADIISGNFDVPLGALDNVPPSNDASALTTGTLGTSRLPAGSVIQVVQAISSNYQSTSSTTPVGTGLTASITPQSATNKILILINASGAGTNANTTAVEFSIYKDSASLFVFDRLCSYTNSGGSAYGVTSTTYLDTPSTTSTLTYELYYRKYSGTGNAYINNYASGAASYSTITLMEIAA